MGVIATAVKHMLYAGMDEDTIVAAIAEMEANVSPKRTARQDRNKRYYESKKASETGLKATEQDASDASDGGKTPLACVDAKLKTTQIDPVKKTPSRDVLDFKAELASLDSDRLEALIKHRKSKKAQMTGHAARLFLKDVAACGISLADAVDTCISRNWITVKPDWIAKPSPRGSPNGKPLTAAEMLLHRRNETRNQTDDERSPDRPRLIAAR